MNAAELIKKWDERDNRYAIRKVAGYAAPLSDAEVISVKMFRRLETQDLHPDEADIALLEISHAPMGEFRAATRCSFAEVALLKQQDVVAA